MKGSVVISLDVMCILSVHRNVSSRDRLLKFHQKAKRRGFRKGKDRKSEKRKRNKESEKGDRERNGRDQERRTSEKPNRSPSVIQFPKNAPI